MLPVEMALIVLTFVVDCELKIKNIYLPVERADAAICLNFGSTVSSLPVEKVDPVLCLNKKSTVAALPVEIALI